MFVVQLNLLHSQSVTDSIPKAIRRSPEAAYQVAKDFSDEVVKALGCGRAIPCLEAIKPDYPALAVYIEGASGRRLFEYWIYEVEDMVEGGP